VSPIGIDIGYGYTKSFTLNNGIIKKVVLPTAISAYTPDFHFGEKSL
jgi:hypothetical protein